MISRRANVYAKPVSCPDTFGCKMSSRQKYDIISGNLLSHPGEILREEFLNPLRLTQRELADAIHVPYQKVNNIVNGHQSITPSTALRLAKFFNISTDFWMILQMRWDMYFAQQDEMEILKTIKPMHSAE